MNQQTLLEVAEDSPCHCQGWCFLRNFLLYAASDRVAMQIRLMVDYRYLLGLRFNHEVKDEESTRLWIDEGYAKRFGEIYDANPQITHQELKKRLFEIY